MDFIRQDLRYALRMLAKRPGFTVVAVLTIALGVGANTMIFSVVNAVLLRPLPFPGSERAVRIGEGHSDSSNNTGNFTYATFLDLGDRTESLDHIAAARFWADTLTDGGEPEQVSSLLVSAEFFPALGVDPAIGRTFLPEEDRPGNDGVVVIGYALWQRRFGGDPGLVGKVIKVSGTDRVVIGVMPRGFQTSFLFPGQYDLWRPLVPTGPLRGNRRSHLLGVIGRLNPGFTLTQARHEMTSFAALVDEQNPGVDPGLRVNVVGLQDKLVDPVRPALIVLLGVVGCVLLIACANVANLLLARAAAREKEIAVRLALGAGRSRILRQLLTESLLLALTGGAAGLLLAVWGVDSIAALSPGGLPRLSEVNVDGRVLAFTFAISLVTGVLFGLAPALQLGSISITESLKEGARGSLGKKRRWLRQALVVTEVAASMLLLVAAGLLINSFWRLLQVDRGFDAQNVLAVNVVLPPARYSKSTQQVSFMGQALDRLAEIPDVRSVGLGSSLPLTGGPSTDFVIEGRPPVDPEHEPIADIEIVDAGYFQTLRVPLRQGRVFGEGDTPFSKKVMVISETMARQYWPNESPIGGQVTMKDWGPPLTGEVVGVVGDVKANGLDKETRPMIYWPYTQFPSIFNNFVLRTEGDPLAMAGAVKAKIWSIDSQQPVARVQTMEQVLADSIAPSRFNMLLVGLFAFLALVLATVGIYSVISYTVAQRTNEIGIRVALGARGLDVLKLIVRQGMALTVLGIGLGLLSAMGLTRLMTGLLFGVSPTDAVTLATIALLLFITALAACLVPALKATRIDPMLALRYE
jgi:putative ABC transport system permease protein